MKKTVRLFLLSFFLSATCMAQELKLQSATRQETTGRLSHEHINHHSICYRFSLSHVNKDIVFDSLYMPNIAIKLDQTLDSRDPNGSLYVRINATGDTYNILVSNPPQLPSNKGQDTATLRQFTGDGLIIYTCKGKNYAIPIVNMKLLHPARIE